MQAGWLGRQGVDDADRCQAWSSSLGAARQDGLDVVDAVSTLIITAVKRAAGERKIKERAQTFVRSCRLKGRERRVIVAVEGQKGRDRTGVDILLFQVHLHASGISVVEEANPEGASLATRLRYRNRQVTDWEDIVANGNASGLERRTYKD